ncbi:MAG: TetR/AcrR family transcriptional regulator [Clostridium sp.]|uniref:TetR/AcrR family transcriptional regulator n=1 Tax=Clostridium sp. TaxID=1506 RepID=UPI0039EA99F1
MEKRSEIIQVAADLFHKNGYNNVGIQQILNVCGIPKGSFYYYFSSKEKLFSEVTNFFINQMFEILDQFPKTIEGLRGFFDLYFSRFKQMGFERGCPLGNCAIELSDSSKMVREDLMNWTTEFTRRVSEILKNEGINNSEAVGLSSFILSSFEGVLLKGKIDKNEQALQEFNYFIFEKLLKF